LAARIIAFALGGLFCHQLSQLPDPLYTGLAPLLLLPLFLGVRSLGLPAAFVVGVAWTALAAHQGLASRLPPGLQGVDLTVSGQVIQVPLHDGNRIRFLLALDRVQGSTEAWSWSGCRIRLTWYRAPAETMLRANERWRMTVRLKVPRGSRNMAGFDWEHRALREGICATGYVRASPAAMRQEAGGFGLHRLRQRLVTRIDAHLAGLPAAGLVRALGVGLRDQIDAKQRWLMQSTGTAHLMAISGLHVGLAAGAGLALATFVVRLWPGGLLLAPRSHWGALGALLAAAGYAALAGFSIPTQRALFMLMAYLAAALCRRRCGRGTPLALALAALLLMDPLAVFDPATWLSFAAVAGLMWALAPAPRTSRRRSLRWLTDITRLQVAACAVIAPVTVLFFSYQPLAAPLANLLAVPVTGFVVVPAILAGLLLDQLSVDFGGELLRFAAHVLGTLLEILQRLSALDALLMPVATPSPFAFLCALVGAALVVSVVSPWVRLLGLAWFAPLLVPTDAAPAPGSLQLRVLDVGQGLASVVRTRTRVLVFDAGPSWGRSGDAGAGIVAPTLRSAGVGRVDTLIVSHHHADHAGGAPGLDRSMVLERVIGDSGRIERTGSPCVRGMAWHWDGYEFRILHPREPAVRGNDASCVLQVRGAAGSLLLPADVERDGEAALLRAFGTTLASTVLVIPHHGSRTSSTTPFLDAVAPALAINSSGHRNRFRLPALEVIGRYRRRGASVLDTACHGEIIVDLSPGLPPAVRTWHGGQLRFWHSRDRAPHCEP
jgi:competence protein ComEC